MKPINKTAIGLLALLLIACSKENGISLPYEEEAATAAVKMEINIDPADAEGIQTRVGGDGKVPTGYQLRYIMEVYAQGQESAITRIVKTSSDYTPISFDNVCLPVGNTYTAVYWADLTKDDKPTTGYFYVAPTLRNIEQKTLQSGAYMQDPNYWDAYTGKQEFTVNAAGISNPATLSVTLKRPLARIEIQKIVLGWSGIISANPCRIGYRDGTEPEQRRPASAYDALKGEVITTQPSPVRKYGFAEEISTSDAQSGFNLADYVFVGATPRTLCVTVDVLNLTIQAPITSYGKAISPATNGTPLFINLTKPNTKITIKGVGTGGTLKLDKVDP